MSIFDRKPSFECRCVNGTTYELTRNGKTVHLRQDLGASDEGDSEGTFQSSQPYEPWVVLDFDTIGHVVSLHDKFEDAMTSAREYLMALEAEKASPAEQEVRLRTDYERKAEMQRQFDEAVSLIYG